MMYKKISEVMSNDLASYKISFEESQNKFITYEQNYGKALEEIEKLESINQKQALEIQNLKKENKIKQNRRNTSFLKARDI